MMEGMITEVKGLKKVCTYCGKDKHVYEQCFERLGYPDCYKGKKNKKGKVVAQVSFDFSPYMDKETPFDFEFENNVQNGKTYLDQRLVTANLQLDLKFDWIVEIGSSDHMSPHLYLFQSIRVLKKPIKKKLPDETSKWVDKVGHVQINSSLILHSVFYVPDFKAPSTRKGHKMMIKYLALFHIIAEPNVPNTLETNSSPSEHSTSEHQSHAPTVSPSNQVPPTIRSSRPSTQPAWLKDFVTSKHKGGMAVADNPATK
ncbi:hypothetical protein Tco_1203931 [Tanacetum coccineum]